MDTRQIILHALIDAIDWQMSLADAHSGCNDGQTAKSFALISDYRKLMKRRYGSDRTPMEQMLDNDKVKSVPLSEVVNNPPRKFNQGD